MDTIGQTLKKARESRQQSVPDVAHAIRANIRYIEAIEVGNFGIFPAPIYALGFIRLYAERVGVDFQPLEKAFWQLEEQPAPAAKLSVKIKRTLNQVPASQTSAPVPAPAQKDFWPAAPKKTHWQALTKRWNSLLTVRLPVDTWKTILAVTSMTLLLIVAAVICGWYLSVRNGVAPAAPATRWLAEPPAPYLNAE